MYTHGQGVRKDYAEAMRWYRKAADKGDVVAMQNIAIFYEGGFGVPKSTAEAAKWRAKADAAEKSKP